MAVEKVTKEKKKKKKIKVEEEEADGVVQDAGNTNVMQSRDVSVQTVVKREPVAVNTRDGENEEKKKKKKKKKVKEEVEADVPVTLCYDASVQTTIKAEPSETTISEAPEKTRKKKKRKTKAEPELLQEEEISEDRECLVSKKKKAKKKGYDNEVEGMNNKNMKVEVEVKEDLGHSVETVEKKKKKKKRKNEQELNTELEDGETKKKRKNKEAVDCEEEKQKVKKKKKKPSAEEEPDDITSSEKPEKNGKKLKKKSIGVDEGESHPHANGGHVSSADKTKKKKVMVEADDVIEKMEAEPAGKKGRKEDRNKTPEKVQKKKSKEERHEALKKRARKATDIVFLSAKPGNQDEVSIDQARRLALQRDVDEESQPKPNLGQWGSAQFDSSDRQAKFLRLMGGFKKSSQPVAGSSASANMALGKEGQQTLQQGLLGEFERAQSRRMDFNIKGAGLGFTAPSNKTFWIDTNARNSVRFDD